MNEAECGPGSLCEKRCTTYNDALVACFEGETESELSGCRDCLLAPSANKVGRDFADAICSNVKTCESICGSCFEAVNALATCAWKCTGKVAEAPSAAPQESQVPSIAPSGSASNVFNRPEEHQNSASEAPFEQNVTVTLSGLTELLNKTQREAYVRTTQSFLRAKGTDETAIVEFVSQRLLQQTRQRFRRDLQVGGVEVRTRIGSWEDKAPGEAAANLLSTPDSNFIKILQQQIEEVESVNAAPVDTSDPSSAPTPTTLSPTKSPSTPTTVSPTKSPSTTDDPSPETKEKDRSTLMYILIAVFSVLALCACGIVCAVIHLRKRNSGDKPNVLSDEAGWSNEGHQIEVNESHDGDY